MAAHSLSLILSKTPICVEAPNAKPKTSSSFLSLSLPLSSLYGCKLTIQQYSKSNRFALNCQPSTTATVLSSLPTAKPERASSEKVPKWSARAIKAFALGELEARNLKYPNTGTEALLMGILVEGTSRAAKFLRANGITFLKVREETVNLLGKSDLFFFSPEHPPLTEPAQKALDWAVDEKLKSGESGEVTPTHVLLGIWSQRDSAGRRILETLGFKDEKANELAKSVNDETVFEP